MKKNYLSKSDFKVAMTCPTKLYYRKLKYPTTNDENEFMQMLAEGGYMVGKLATLLFPGGIDLSEEANPEISAYKTRDLLLANENIVIYEASVLFQDFLIRVDVLEKKGNTINLIEVKAKSYDSANAEKEKSKLGEYLDDVVFQYFVISNAFPQFKIVPYLFMPDKAKATNLEGLNGLFQITKKESKPGSKFISYDVDFNGNPNDLLKDDILTLIDLTPEVMQRLPIIQNCANEFAASINPELSKIETNVSINCKTCEFRSESPDKDGFRQCWGPLADAPPDILTLNQLGNVNRHHENIINDLISKGKVKLSDFPSEILNPENRKNNKPYQNNRPFMQLTYKDEWISDELKAGLRILQKKIHFIDFETSRMALPYHKGMRPYELVAFQWSCHTLDTVSNTLTHKEWINMEDTFPNFAFAESLMSATNDGGEILIWSHHENSVLKEIHAQMEKYNYTNTALSQWIEQVVKFTKDDSTEFTDMCKMADKGYFHPFTKARSSIKVILPAVLKNYTNHEIQHLLQNFDFGINLFRRENGEVMSPYKLLPSVEEIDAYEINEGTAAMRAYQDMLYGFAKNDAVKKQAIKNSLLSYCKLDTLAMVIIYKHWMSL
jgi:hypothetical protein